MKQRLASQSKKQLRNLRQYSGMTDEEFEEMFESLKEDELDEAALEAEIEKGLSEFEDDYDLSDMKINDRIVLRDLVISMISLEALEKLFVTQRENLSDANILLMDRTSGVMSKLRHDISDMQSDLKLTRRIRKEGIEESFMSNDIVILGGARTAIGTFGGALAATPPSTLGSIVARAA
ncbi:hypothetical protein LCGC14_1296670, partial [marine sediment metagenome]